MKGMAFADECVKLDHLGLLKWAVERVRSLPSVSHLVYCPSITLSC